jgi:hypothetical protein
MEIASCVGVSGIGRPRDENIKAVTQGSENEEGGEVSVPPALFTVPLSSSYVPCKLSQDFDCYPSFFPPRKIRTVVSSK